MDSLDKKLRLFLVLGILLMNICIVLTAQEDDDDEGAGDDVPTSICTTVCEIAKIFMFVIVFIVMIMLVVHGARWATSAEDPGARAKAKEGMMHVIIAFVAVFFALYLMAWLASQLGVGTLPIDPIKLMGNPTCSELCSL